MKPNRAWRGALELTINDVPLAVAVELYTRVKKSRNESFRSLAPSGQLAESAYIDPASGDVFPKDQVRKGAKVGPHEFVPMTPEALEQISDGVKTETIPAGRFAPVDSIAWDLAIDRFAVRPQDDVAGAAQALNIVYNGLKATGTAWLAQVSLTGGHDAILALYADGADMWGALLPFEDELYPVPTHTFETDTKAEQLMGSLITDGGVEDFDHSAFASEYRPRRQAAIDAVIAGQPVSSTAPAAKAKAAGPDLMALLEASVDKAKPARKPAAKRTRKVAA